MKLKHPGKTTSRVEVTHVSINCVWVLLDDSEFMLPYSQFPWFKNATIAQIHNVIAKSKTHLYWPDLDVDLDVERMNNPEKFPLVSK